MGGFSYADVLNSAKGWAGTIRFNTRLWTQFQEFYGRADTWALGVCNGCQLMALLGWVPGGGPQGLLPDTSQPRFVHNTSTRSALLLVPPPDFREHMSVLECHLAGFSRGGGANTDLDLALAHELLGGAPARRFHGQPCWRIFRFESRWTQVRVSEDSPAIFTKGMGGASVGIWCAHGEGQLIFPDQDVRRTVASQNLAPIRWRLAPLLPADCLLSSETTNAMLVL